MADPWLQLTAANDQTRAALDDWWRECPLDDKWRVWAFLAKEQSDPLMKAVVALATHAFCEADERNRYKPDEDTPCTPK